ncbi:MAG: glycerophosphodiester phosphodiesterase, partial [Alistipes sp.]|nr:glycerophosphodiester phosphodiesterase [Alistipes sp.]
MKKLTLTLLAALSIVSLSAQDFHDNGVIAHRGAWKNTGHPQNTLASFRAAAEMGCHGSECDVHLTLDDSLVVFHDLSHKGMLIEKTLYADLVKEPLKDFSQIPTLREYMLCAKKYPRTKLVLDIKTPKDNSRAVKIALASAKLAKELQIEKQVEYLVG